LDVGSSISRFAFGVSRMSLTITPGHLQSPPNRWKRLNWSPIKVGMILRRKSECRQSSKVIRHDGGRKAKVPGLILPISVHDYTSHYGIWIVRNISGTRLIEISEAHRITLAQPGGTILLFLQRSLMLVHCSDNIVQQGHESMKINRRRLRSNYLVGENDL